MEEVLFEKFLPIGTLFPPNGKDASILWKDDFRPLERLLPNFRRMNRNFHIFATKRKILHFSLFIIHLISYLWLRRRYFCSTIQIKTSFIWNYSHFSVSLQKL